MEQLLNIGNHARVVPGTVDTIETGSTDASFQLIPKFHAVQVMPKHRLGAVQNRSQCRADLAYPITNVRAFGLPCDCSFASMNSPVPNSLRDYLGGAKPQLPRHRYVHDSTDEVANPYGVVGAALKLG